MGTGSFVSGTIGLIAALGCGAVIGCSSSSSHSVGPSTSGDAGVCALGEKRCDGNVPQTCGETGKWQNGSACTDPTPACSGGICAPFRLRGRLSALGVGPAPGSVRLKDDALEHTARLCGGSVCLSGGIIR